MGSDGGISSTRKESSSESSPISAGVLMRELRLTEEEDLQLQREIERLEVQLRGIFFDCKGCGGKTQPCRSKRHGAGKIARGTLQNSGCTISRERFLPHRARSPRHGSNIVEETISGYSRGDSKVLKLVSWI